MCYRHPELVAIGWFQGLPLCEDCGVLAVEQGVEP